MGRRPSSDDTRDEAFFDMWLTRFAIQRPIITAMAFIALSLFGLMSFAQIGRSDQPNVAFPIVVVVAQYPGASPAEMEKLILKPLEDQIDGIEHLDRMTATAQEGVGTVAVQFKIDTNLDFAAIDVQRRVDTARVYMPTDLDPPEVIKNGASSPMMTYAISSKSMSRAALADLLHDRITPEIAHIPSVADTDVRGDVTREIQVEPDPQRMEMVGATLPDLFAAIAGNNANLPGGRIDEPTQETTVSVHADIINANDILGIPLPTVSAANRTLTIGDVARVVDGHADQRVVSHYNGSPAIIMDVDRTVTSDELKSTDALRKRITEISAQYPAVHFQEIYAPADYTKASLTGVVESLLEGILLTAVVLMFFLHAWRNAVVVMLAIPASLLATFIVMHMLNFLLDNVSLMGLSLIIGILVDDSIVVLENITRHRDMGQSPLEAAISGRTEIGGAAVAITLVDVVVFLPIAFMSGIVGKYMIEFGIVVVVATLFSLLVSFTLTPMLAAKWSVVRRSAEPPKALEWFQTGFDRLSAFYRDRIVTWALAHKLVVVVSCFALVAGAMALPVLGLVQSEFVPSEADGNIPMTVTFPAGTTIETTQKRIDALELAILHVPGVERTISTVGSKPSGFSSTLAGNVARLTATMYQNRRRDTQSAVEAIRKLDYLVPGSRFTVSQAGGSGQGSVINYTLSGPEDQIDGAAAKLAEFIRGINGTANVQTGAEEEAPRLNIQIDRRRAAVLGVSPGTAATAARTAVGGIVATRVRTETRLIDVRLQSPLTSRSSIAQLRTIKVRASDGSYVNLSQIANFTMTKAPTKLEREARERVATVTGDIDPGKNVSLGSVTNKIDAAIAGGLLPGGVHLKAQGDSEFLAETLSSLGFALITSFMLVYMLMVVLYGSFGTPFVVMFSVPVAAVGALGALAITHQTINLFSMIGLIMLFGLVAKNGILLVDYANTLKRRGMRSYDAMLEAAGTRLRPIVMTTAAMIGGMLPLALGVAEGAAIRQSIGTVIIGGLLSSLLMTLVLVPVIYVFFGTRGERRADRRSMRREHAAKEYALT
jgi:HAE1 family hydrophobic/amphiphilic exporter-1